MKWCEYTLDAKLGPRPGNNTETAPGGNTARAPGQQGGGYNLPPELTQAVNNSTQILMMMHDQKKASEAPQPAPKATAKKEVYTVHQIAKLRGYAGLNWNERLPEFWYEALTTTKENEHRRMLTERVVTWM